MQELYRQAHSLLGIQLTTSQLAALQIYETELLEWNTRFNLTAIENPEQVRIKHFLDSLTALLVMGNPASKRVIDIGTGAGFPGLPLKIVCPQMHLTLVESVGKKAEFCRHIIYTLKLPQVEVVQERAEVIGQQPRFRERYDWAVARAVASMPVLVELLLPLVRLGGKMLAMKGASAPDESQKAARALQILGGRLHRLQPVTLPGITEQRYLVVVEKLSATPDAYPRRSGLPTKKPL
jgi:16S rRNA (guanine527-N7)-methyltransferase